MNKIRRTTDILIVIVYLGLVGLLYYLDFPTILGLLSIPWSLPLMLFSGLVLHATVDGKEFIVAGYIVGAVLNALVFLVLRNRR